MRPKVDWQPVLFLPREMTWREVRRDLTKESGFGKSCLVVMSQCKAGVKKHEFASNEMRTPDTVAYNFQETHLLQSPSSIRRES